MKKLALLMALIMSVVLFASCGGDEAPAASEAPAAEAPAAEAPAAEAPAAEAPAEEAPAEELYTPNFTLINNTGADLTYIGLSLQTDTEHGENMLPTDYVLVDGGEVPIEFAESYPAGTLFDLYTEDTDGDAFHTMGLDLTAYSAVQLDWYQEDDGSFGITFTQLS